MINEQKIDGFGLTASGLFVRRGQDISSLLRLGYYEATVVGRRIGVYSLAYSGTTWFRVITSNSCRGICAHLLQQHVIHHHPRL